eukprot:scaffold4238_cov63-Cylindrotheca_fusiformis.AAC.2
MKRSSRNPYWHLCLYMMIISIVLVCGTASPTVRYLHGRLQVDDSSVMTTTTDGTDSRAAAATVLLEYHTNTTVAKAWRHCQTNLLDCVSFGYQATARFPGETVAVSFYSVADWHVNVNNNDNDLSHQPAFIEEESWHLYVNTTREQRILKDEVNGVLQRLRAATTTTTTATGEINNNNNNSGDGRASSSSSSSLRNGLRRARVAENDNHHIVARPPPSFRAEQERMASLMSLFYMVQYKDLRVPCSKLITRAVLNIAMDETEMEEIRGVALQVLLVLTDSYETPRLLNEYGDLLTNMESIIISQQQGRQQQTDNDDDDDNKGTWGMVAKVALDIVSNMALHHTVEYPFVPSPKLLNALHQIVMSDETGPIGVQATLALIHASTTTPSTNSKTKTTQQQQQQELPEDKLVALVDLLEATIDGDPAFGYDWELIPGPLSAIQTLIVESKKTSGTRGGWFCCYNCG